MEVVNTDGDLGDSRPAMKWFRKTSDRDHPRQHSAPRPNTIWWKLVRLVDGVQVAVPAWRPQASPVCKTWSAAFRRRVAVTGSRTWSGDQGCRWAVAGYSDQKAGSRTGPDSHSGCLGYARAGCRPWTARRAEQGLTRKQVVRAYTGGVSPLERLPRRPAETVCWLERTEAHVGLPRGYDLGSTRT